MKEARACVRECVVDDGIVIRCRSFRSACPWPIGKLTAGESICDDDEVYHKKIERIRSMDGSSSSARACTDSKRHKSIYHASTRR